MDLCGLARKICIEEVPKALQRNMDISFKGLQEALYVNGDAILLGNLLDNAIAYGHNKGNITVELHRYPSPCLRVEDDGPGISEAEIGKIFERFYRIPGSSGDGCGLGLAIVKEISELHKARLKICRVNQAGGTRIDLIFDKPNQR